MSQRVSLWITKNSKCHKPCHKILAQALFNSYNVHIQEIKGSKLEDTGKKLQIRFGKSTSKKYRSAVKIAEQFSHCYTSGYDHIITICPESIIHDVHLIGKLWDIVGGWNGSRIIAGGSPRKAEVFNCLKCYAEYEKAIIQDLHCKRTKEYSGWSCKRLLAIERHALLSSYTWTNRVWWYEVGYFKTSSIWAIDKPKITEILQREVEQQCLWLCPQFDWKKVEIHIGSLPDEIDLNKSDDWEVHRVKEPGMEDRPVGIKLKKETIEIESFD